MFGQSTKKQYLRWREINTALNSRIVDTLTTYDFLEGARSLGLLRNKTIRIECDLEVELLMDHCIYNLRRRDRRNAVERFAQSDADLSEQERAVLVQMSQARFRILSFFQRPRGCTAKVVDLLRFEQTRFVDIGLCRTAVPGLTIACHTIQTEIDDCWASTGVGLPLDPSTVKVILDKLASLLPANIKSLSQIRSDKWAAIAQVAFRTALQFGCADKIKLLDPRKRLPHRFLQEPTASIEMAGF